MSKLYYFSRLTPERVDKENGIVRGVSVITGGIQAKGHPLGVDSETVREFYSACEAKGKIKTKANHKSGVKEVNGYLSDFRIVQCPTGEQLKADWHLLRKDPNYEHTLEIAERMPDTVGLSGSFTSPKGMEKGQDTKFGKMARVKEVLSVDFVTDPAANPDGLFEVGGDQVDKGTNNMSEQTSDQKLDQILKLTTDLSARLESVEQFNADMLAEREAFEEEAQEQQEEEGEEEEGQEEEQESGEEDPRDAALFAALQRIEQLEGRFSEADQAEELAKYDTAFSVLEEKLTMLAAQRDEAIQALEERTTPRVAASSSDGIRLFSRNASGQSEFERHISQFKAGSKEQREAIREFIAEQPDLYREHLENKTPVASM